MKPYIVHRGDKVGVRCVTHRQTGRSLGTVGQHYGNTLEGMWSAWSPIEDIDGGLGEPAETIAEAIEQYLFDPGQHEPMICRRLCPRCTNVFPCPGPCENCETKAAALARSRRENKANLEHYDWLLELRVHIDG